MDIDVKNLRLLLHHLDSPSLVNKAARKIHDQVQQHEGIKKANAERIPGIHPSALARCARMAWMEFSSVPRVNTDVPEPVRRAGAIGTALHSMYQKNYLRAAKSGLFEFFDEVPLDADSSPEARRLNLRGRADGLILFEGRRLGQEYKSVSGIVFKSLKGPPEDHLLQGSIYQECLGFEAMWFIYISRETFVDRHIVMRIPPQYWEAMKRRAQVILENVLMKSVPPGTDDMRTCSICAYNLVCPEPRGSVLPEEKLVWVEVDGLDQQKS